MLQQLSVLRKAIANRLQRIRFLFLGPTTVHLELEVYLLCSLLFLSVASLRGLYKESFGSNAADYYFICVICVTLSRHLLFRIFCIWDPSTHASPSFFGLISHFLQSFLTAGQTVDRPVPLVQLSMIHQFPSDRVVSTATTSSAASPAVAPSPSDRLLQITGGCLETIGREEGFMTWHHVLPSVLVYAMQIPRQYIWFPLARLFGTGHGPSLAHILVSSNMASRRRKKVPELDTWTFGWMLQRYQALQYYTLQLLLVYGPSLQFILSSKVCCDVLVLLLSLWTGKSSSSSLSWIDFSRGYYLQRHATLLTINTHDTNIVRQTAESEKALMVGSYDRQLTPSMADVLWILLACGTLCSCLFFSRIMAPLPDLASGGNVSKDIRFAVTTSAASGKKGHRATAPVVGAPSSFMARVKAWYSKAMSSSSATSESAAWSERQHSLATSNRLHAILYTTACRVLENVIVVGFLPRTRWACRAMGHCPAGPSIWELSRILYPGGLYSLKRTDHLPASGFMETDPFSAVWAMMGVITVSTTLLLSQGIVLNRSYLSTAAYRSLEWEFVSKAATQQSQGPVWEAKRKYSKGELVYYPDRSGALYRARVNAPDGHPSFNSYRLFGEELLTELGNPATSRTIARLASVQYGVTIVYFAVWGLLYLFGLHSLSRGLLWAVFANMLAVSGILAVTRSAAYSVATKRDQSRSSEVMRTLQELNAEILKRNA